MKKLFCLLAVAITMVVCGRAMAGKQNTDAAEPTVQSGDDTNLDSSQPSAQNNDEPNMEAAQTPALSSDDKNIQVEEAGAEVVQFDGEKLGLAWQADNDGDTIKEFIPNGQDLDTWKKLAAVREFPKIDDARGFAEGMVQKLHEDSPDAPSTITKNDKTGEVVLDFVAWPKDKSFVEFNVWKFRQRPEGGIFAEQFAVRDYKDPEGFVKNLKNVRERLIDEMTKGGLQQQTDK